MNPPLEVLIALAALALSTTSAVYGWRARAQVERSEILEALCRLGGRASIVAICAQVPHRRYGGVYVALKSLHDRRVLVLAEEMDGGQLVLIASLVHRPNPTIRLKAVDEASPAFREVAESVRRTKLGQR